MTAAWLPVLALLPGLVAAGQSSGPGLSPSLSPNLSQTATQSLNQGTAQSAGHVAGSGIVRGNLSVYPWLNLLLGYDSNLYRSNAKIERLGGLGVKSAWQSVVEPGVRVNYLHGRSSYDLSYFARLGNVSGSSADDFADQQVTATANWDLSLRNRASLDYQFWDWHDPRGTGSPVDSSRANFSKHPDRWTSNRVTLGYSFGAPGANGRIDLLAGYRTRNYTNNNQEFRDNDRTVLGGTFYWRVKPKLSWLFQLGWDQIGYTRQVPGTLSLDSDETIAYTGVTWDLSAKTTGTVKVGWLTKDFTAPQRQDISDFGWSAAIQLRPWARTTFNVETDRAPAESSTGLSDAVVISALHLGWVQQWPRNIYTRVGLLGTTDDYVGEPRVDHRYSASGGVFYQMRRWLELGLDYSYESRTSDQPLAEYTANTVLFSLRTAY